MSTKYNKGADVPTETLIKRLSELSVACGSKELMEREFTRRIPAELDRDADLVLSIAADRIAELEGKLNRIEVKVCDPNAKPDNYNLGA